MLWVFRKLLKLDSSITVGQWFYDRITGNWLAIVALCGGFSMSYLAAISRWIQAWGPVGWGAVGILTATLTYILVGLGTFLVSVGINKRSQAKYFSALAERPRSINPLRDNFERERILISDFHSVFGVANERKIFRNCEIHGPGAILVLGNSNWENPKLFSCDLINLGDKVQTFSATVFITSSFYNCSFFNLSIFLVPPAVQVMVADFVRFGRQVPLIMGAPVQSLKSLPDASPPAPGLRSSLAETSEQPSPG